VSLVQRPGMGFAPCHDLSVSTGMGVIPKHLRVRFLEGEGQPSSHHTDAVDGVDEDVGVGFEEVSVNDARHGYRVVDLRGLDGR